MDFCFHSHFCAPEVPKFRYNILHPLPSSNQPLSQKPTFMDLNQDTLTSGFDWVWPMGGDGKTAEDQKMEVRLSAPSLLSSCLCPWQWPHLVVLAPIGGLFQDSASTSLLTEFPPVAHSEYKKDFCH